MLKKLIKYGNSQALLLNRSILGLLGIEDGDTVKLRVEGDVLLVTRGDDGMGRQSEIQAGFEAELKKEEESHNKYLEDTRFLSEVIKEYQAKLENNTFDPSKLEDLHDSPKFKESMKQVKAIEEKHGFNNIELSEKMLGNKEYMKGMALLLNKRKEMDADDFSQEMMDLRYKYFPELKAYDEDMQQISD